MTDGTSIGSVLLADDAYRPAGVVDALVPDEFGLYAIRMREGSSLPAPFDVASRHRLVYIGEARTQTLRRRLLGNELRARGNGTFFRSLGAVLGFRPPRGSLAGRARTQNYRFDVDDRIGIITWIDQHLDVSWVALPPGEVHAAEVGLIREHRPVLNLRDNPGAMPELRALRQECRQMAAAGA